MATKCIDQIAVPVATAAAAAQTRPFSPGWARARRSKSRAAQAPTTATAELHPVSLDTHLSEGRPER
jgi:hypothetical protein